MDTEAIELNLGPVIRGLRKEKGFTQQQLSSAMEMTIVSLQTWERGLNGNPRLDSLLKLAQVLEVPLSEIIALAESAPKANGAVTGKNGHKRSSTSGTKSKKTVNQ